MTLQIAVCSLLWGVLKQQQEQLAPWRGLLVLGWIAFALSILAASLLLAMIPHAVNRQPRPAEAPPEHLSRAQRLVPTLSIAQYARLGAAPRRALALSRVLFLQGECVMAQAGEPQVPSEARSLHRLQGTWRGEGTLEVDGAPSPVQGEAHFTPTAAGLGLASDIRVRGPALPEEILISGLFGFDPGARALHYYAVTSDGDCHDHVGNWSGPDTLRFGYSGCTAEGQGMEEDIRFSFEGEDLLTATNVTHVDGARRFVLRVALRR